MSWVGTILWVGLEPVSDLNITDGTRSRDLDWYMTLYL